MHIISIKKLRMFWERHANAEAPLSNWYKVVEKADWGTFAEVRATYAHADPYGKYVIFNVGGNNFRIIAEINYIKQTLYLRHVLTHAEYDRGDWKPR